MIIASAWKLREGSFTALLVGAECLDDNCKTVCRVTECDTADECGCGDDGDGDGGDDGVSVNINHTPHSTFSWHPDTALRTFLGGPLWDMILNLMFCGNLKSVISPKRDITLVTDFHSLRCIFIFLQNPLDRERNPFLPAFLGYRNVTGISIVHCSGLTGLGLVLKYLVRKPRPRPRALRAETMIMIMIDIHIQLEID